MTGRRDLKPLPFTTGEKENGDVDFNEYDKVRKIQPVLPPDTKTCYIGARTLSTEMSCPICLDLLSLTYTAKECLHRFCFECITMALQRGNKECPTCRKKLVSRRSLRPDPNFDLLIAAIWPDRSLYDQMQLSDCGTTQSSNEALMNSIEEGMKAQAQEGNGRKRKRAAGGFENDKPRRPDELEEPVDENEISDRTMDFYNFEPICDFSASPSANNGDFGDDDDMNVYADEVLYDDYPRNEQEGADSYDVETMDEREGYDGDYVGEDVEGDEYYNEALEGLTPEQIEELRVDQDELYAMEYEYDEVDFSDDDDEENEIPEQASSSITVTNDEPQKSEECKVDCETEAKEHEEPDMSNFPQVAEADVPTAENSPVSQDSEEKSSMELKCDPSITSNIGPAILENLNVGLCASAAPSSTASVEHQINININPIHDSSNNAETGPSAAEKVEEIPQEGGEGSIDDSDSSSSTYSSSGFTSSTSTESSTLSIDFSDDTVPGAAEELQPSTSMPMEVDPPNEAPPAPSSSNITTASSSVMLPPPTSLTALAQSIPPCQENIPFEKLDLNPHEIHPPNNTIPTKDRLHHWLANSPSSPLTPEENMHELPERRADDENDSDSALGCSEEVEAELLPAFSLQSRDCPDELLTPRYVRGKHDVTMEHLSEFIHQRAMEEAQSNQSDYDADPVPTIPKPLHFYVFSRNCGHHLKKIFLHETLATAASAMTRNDHLVIFYDTEEIRPGTDNKSTLQSVVPEYFLGLPTV